MLGDNNNIHSSFSASATNLANYEKSADGITKVEILGEKSIVVGYNLIPRIVEELPSLGKYSTVVIITDTNLEKLHLSQLKSSLEEGLPKHRILSYIIPSGEQSKSRKIKAEIEDFMFSKGCVRDTVMIGLGGGVIGDLVGYVAATFMRGVSVIHMPTSLLAMVDSSIGGKTAIDVPSGKNLIGAFWQPKRVYVDLHYLTTLPKREFFNGMAEVIKTAVISDASEFIRLEDKFDNISRIVYQPNELTKTDRDELEKVVLSSIRFKAYVVTVDEKEANLRGLLNFGHSIGHAIEAKLSPYLLHGECVSIGMIEEAEISRSLGHINQVTIARLTKVLKKYKLPTSLNDPILNDRLTPDQRHLQVNELMDIIKLDKKNIANKKRIVLIKEIGQPTNPYPEFVEDEELIRAMSNGVQLQLKEPLSSQQTSIVSVPGSKSISNRALLLAALGEGPIEIEGLLHSDDTQVMLAALSALGNLSYEFRNGGEVLALNGVGGIQYFKSPDHPIYLGNAGTAVRFLTSVCASVSNGEKDIILTGNERMKLRPIQPLVNALRSNGCQIEYVENQGFLPLRFAKGSAGLSGGVIELSADISSQYVSSILIASPYTPNGVTLRLIGGHVISQPYIDMTIAMMADFGVKVQRISDKEYFIPSSKYINPKVYKVEGDASSATYPLSLAAITGTTVTVDNLGSRSLQGDAQFAKLVLEPMGCKVVQTDMTTTVTGPPIGQLRCLPSIDMEPMTDAFLTASVLAAVATTHPTDSNATTFPTEIYGIANQRVKECNRIRAMVDELARMGVHASETEDGLIIEGTPLKKLHPPEGGIRCYDDHRVAMSFSLLATQVYGTVINEKRCVEKTYPNWWDTLRHKLNVPLTGFHVEPEHEHAAPKPKLPNANTSVVIVGMRGAGKTTLGSALAQELGFAFVDLDHRFEEIHQIDVKAYVEAQGWEAFRREESLILENALTDYATSTVISCGGGIVELDVNLEKLIHYQQNGGLVIHLCRDISSIEAYLDAESSRPKYNDQLTVAQVFQTRLPRYQKISNFEFVSLDKPEGIDEINHRLKLRQALTRLVRLANGTYTSSLPTFDTERASSFVCLATQDITPLIEKLDIIGFGSQAIELRADKLIEGYDLNDSKGFQDALEHLRHQVALLKYAVEEHPIIYTLRTKNEAGTLDDSIDDKRLLQLLDIGIKLGCEIIDIQLSFSVQVKQQIQKQKGNSRIIASYHDTVGTLDWSSSAADQLVQQASRYGDIIKLISFAQEQSSNRALQAFLENYYQKTNLKPIIAINMGRLGQITRVTNHYLTPVTHPELQVAAPGQLSSQQIQKARHLLGLTEAKDYYLFGSPIIASPSPKLHTGVFSGLGLPHMLKGLDTTEIATVAEAVRSPSFGGACVTIPHKVAILNLVDELCPIAAQIGAVNTLVKRGNKVYGYNTDWHGIEQPLRRSLMRQSLNPRNNAALIMGAGGTSRAALYALHHVGYSTIYVYNRSSERLDTLHHELSKHLPFTKLDDNGLAELLNSEASEHIHTVIDTLPGHSQVVGLKFLNELYKGRAGVLVKLAYINYEATNQSAESTYPPNVEVVDGLTILLEQARFQTELWTGFRPPLSINRGVLQHGKNLFENLE